MYILFGFVALCFVFIAYTMYCCCRLGAMYDAKIAKYWESKKQINLQKRGKIYLEQLNLFNCGRDSENTTGTHPLNTAPDNRLKCFKSELKSVDFLSLEVFLSSES